MWANLLVNYIDSAKNLASHVYPDILRQLSSDEVKILKHMHANRNLIPITDREALMGMPGERFVFLDQITNLIRLGIVEGVPRLRSEDKQVADKYILGVSRKENEKVIKYLPPNTYVITNFGTQFLEACTR